MHTIYNVYMWNVHIVTVVLGCGNVKAGAQFLSEIVISTEYLMRWR
jgi:hypothetical protein